MRSPVQRNAQSAFGATDREAPSKKKLETERTKPTELADQVDNLLTKRGTSLQITTNMGAFRDRYVPLHPAASALIIDHLEGDGRGLDTTGALFRAVGNRDGALPKAITADAIYEIVRAT